MRVIITAHTGKKQTTVVLTDDSLNNENYVDLLTDKEEYTISVIELLSAVELFDSLRKRLKD